MFESVDSFLQAMVDDYNEITGESVAITDIDHEAVIKLLPVAGGLSMLSARLSSVNDNIHPQLSDDESIKQHLISRGLEARIDAQTSTGRITHTGDEGTQIISGVTRVKYLATGKSYVARESVAIPASGSVDVLYESVDAGQINNILNTGQQFELVVSTQGLDSECVNATSFVDARDEESLSEVIRRIKEHDLRENTGGNLVAYEKWASEASTQVVSAKSYKNPRGLDTVDTIITSGTSDIDSAVDNNETIIRTPSAELVALVQAYIIERNPATDNHLTVAPLFADFDTTLTIEFYDENLRDVILVEIDKIWKKFVYKLQPSDVVYPTALEILIDNRFGTFIKYRRVENFTAEPFYTVPDRTLLNPGTLTVNGGA